MYIVLIIMRMSRCKFKLNVDGKQTSNGQGARGLQLHRNRSSAPSCCVRPACRRSRAWRGGVNITALSSIEGLMGCLAREGFCASGVKPLCMNFVNDAAKPPYKITVRFYSVSCPSELVLSLSKDLH